MEALVIGNFPGFPEDAGGNSALTRLRAEVECNKNKQGGESVTDSSLIHDDLRHILRLLDSPMMANLKTGEKGLDKAAQWGGSNKEVSGEVKRRFALRDNPNLTWEGLPRCKSVFHPSGDESIRCELTEGHGHEHSASWEWEEENGAKGAALGERIT
jgi:hypothetical protein